jgi:hypothetical protein
VEVEGPAGGKNPEILDEQRHLVTCRIYFQAGRMDPEGEWIAW